MSNPARIETLSAATAEQHRQREQPLSGIDDQLFRRLGDVPDGALLLDLASGGGSPSLPAASRYPRAQILGVDTDASAVATASNRAREAGLGNVEFREMNMGHLDLADATADAAISRMGLLLFGDPAAGATELARVLKPMARFSIALWSHIGDNPYMRAALPILRKILPADNVPDPGNRMEALGSAEAVEGWLTTAGMTHVDSTMIEWDARFAGASAWFTYLTTAGPFTPIFARLSTEQLDVARDMAVALTGDGQERAEIVLQSRCRLVWGSR